MYLTSPLPPNFTLIISQSFRSINVKTKINLMNLPTNKCKKKTEFTHFVNFVSFNSFL